MSAEHQEFSSNGTFRSEPTAGAQTSPKSSVRQYSGPPGLSRYEIVDQFLRGLAFAVLFQIAPTLVFGAAYVLEPVAFSWQSRFYALAIFGAVTLLLYPIEFILVTRWFVWLSQPMKLTNLHICVAELFQQLFEDSGRWSLVTFVGSFVAGLMYSYSRVWRFGWNEVWADPFVFVVLVICGAWIFNLLAFLVMVLSEPADTGD